MRTSPDNVIEIVSTITHLAIVISSDFELLPPAVCVLFPSEAVSAVSDTSEPFSLLSVEILNPCASESPDSESSVFTSDNVLPINTVLSFSKPDASPDKSLSEVFVLSVLVSDDAFADTCVTAIPDTFPDLKF